jgi:hypothetical protein
MTTISRDKRRSHSEDRLAIARRLTRRGVLQLGAATAFGWGFADLLALRSFAGVSAGGKAKSVIVLFAWGGMSHLDTWDLKAEASPDIRGQFQPIATTVPGIEISEHLPRIAQQMHHIAVVRSVRHEASDHREAAYWNLTGHKPRLLGQPAILPSRQDWPSIGSQVARALHKPLTDEDIARAARTDQASSVAGQVVYPATRTAELAAALPRTISMPYAIADRGLLNGQYGGFLGAAFDPVYVRPPTGRPYQGVSPSSGPIDLELTSGITKSRFTERRQLLARLERNRFASIDEATLLSSQNRDKAMNMLMSPAVQAAFDLQQEPQPLRDLYGDHICGQSVLMARRLAEAGVPLITVYCCAGDLNGSAGDHWDTHANNFNRLKDDMLPPLDQAGGALLQDLADRGRLNDTLVVFLTEFGRTPQINPGAGRDHFPNCYSVALAGGGIQGGQVYGKSDAKGMAPSESPCGPEDIHATIFHALGIDPQFTIHDLDGRPMPLSNGRPLPLF